MGGRVHGRRRPSATALLGGTLVAAGLVTVGLTAAPLLLPASGGPAAASARAGALESSWTASPGPASPRSSSSPAIPHPRDGEAFGVLRVPRFGADYSRVIAQGVAADEVLDEGELGHYASTAMPGAVGNFAIAGHRVASGGALLHLPDLRRGDAVLVDTAAGTYRYRVLSGGEVAPSDVAVIAPVPGRPGARATRRLITLQTCTPPLIDTDRYVVHGELVGFTPA